MILFHEISLDILIQNYLILNFLVFIRRMKRKRSDLGKEHELKRHPIISYYPTHTLRLYYVSIIEIQIINEVK